MAGNGIVAPEDGSDEIKSSLIDKIKGLLLQTNVVKVYFVDDAINQDTGKETFKGIVSAIIAAGKLDQLKAIQIQNAIDFNTEEAVLLDHIDQTWDTIKPGKQLKYYDKAYTIAGQPENIRDLNVSNNLKEYFSEEQISILDPLQWDAQKSSILAAIPDGKRIIVIFDQDLKLAGGRFEGGAISGEHLMQELKQLNVGEKVLMCLLTHTISEYHEELPKRQDICTRITDLNKSDFFVLAKARLENHEMFGDGIKKVMLNTYCEKVKENTKQILIDAQKATVELIDKFDTYDFDHTVFKSSHHEGVWEPETLLRITDVIFRDEVRKLMISKGYVSTTNQTICSASEISQVEFDIDKKVAPYSDRLKLRHQEIYESEELLNKLRRPIDLGDIFEVTDGEKAGKHFILLAQECDLMVRGADGSRGGRVANLIEIELLTESQLFAEMRRKYQSEITAMKFGAHFFADKYKLEYFEPASAKVGLIRFSESLLIDLNVLDLMVFNESGKAVLDFNNLDYNESFHNAAWKKRFEFIASNFRNYKEEIEKYYAEIASTTEGELKEQMKVKFNYIFSFIKKAGIQISYEANKFTFGIKRVGRLRYPKSKHLLDRYYQHLSRIAEPHDFAN